MSLSLQSAKANKIFTFVIGGVFLLFIAIQFVPVERDNPSVSSEIDAPPEVKNILERSCYDCHSNETRWPWYGKVAPVSWLVAHDVEEAREHLNFSEWGELSEDNQRGLIEESWEEVEEGKMPLKKYLIMHPGAKLSEGDLKILHDWAEGGE